MHELMHIKMYPLDQVTESLITSHFEEGTPAWDFAYRQFFTAPFLSSTGPGNPMPTEATCSRGTWFS